ncbi:hypothetical protein [Robertkochia sediminum]|nr:hypothetical protein [Robertkochia sediminum]
MDVIVFKLGVALVIVGMLLFIRFMAGKSFLNSAPEEEERNAA